MQDYDVQKHKGYLIYAAAAPAEGNKRWHAEGIVFSKDFPKRVEEVHYMKSEADFGTEKIGLTIPVRVLERADKVARGAADEVRAGDQSQDGKTDRAHNSAVGAVPSG
jgi:hypothetical protein